MYDLVIRGATVVDGTGSPPGLADVAVEDGMIVEVGRVVGPARRTVDADGALLTPGFIDLHTHYDGQATWDPHLTPSCWHGVTTAVMGNCGVGFAPVRPERRDWLIEVMEGVEDIPGAALSAGIRWGWDSFPSYIDALGSIPRAVDVAVQVPHSAVRAFVMGDRCHDDATGDDLAAIEKVIADALAAGAVGVSTGRTAGHRTKAGEQVPGTFAPTDELDVLWAALDAAGHGVLQIVPAGIAREIGGDPPGAMDAEVDWLVDLAARHRRPACVSVMEGGRDVDEWRRWFDRFRASNDAGAAPLRPQVASRCFGVLIGHQSTMNPWRYRPTYAALAARHADGGGLVAALRHEATRAAILAETPAYDGPPLIDHFVEHLFDQLFPLGDALDYEPTANASIGARARETGSDPWALLYDTMLAQDGREFVLYPMMNFGRGSYDGLHDMLTDPLTVQGLGDAGAHVGLICDASMTTYLLSYWARDRTRGPRLPIEAAVRRLTADAADLYGLADRGRIEPGKRADLNLIDFDRVGLLSPERVTDLPAGAGRLIQRSTGYLETWVAGQAVMVGDEPTDARPGGVIRGRPA